VDTFWLDSATAALAPVDGPGCPRSRFTFMGGRGGALWRRAVYNLPAPDVGPSRCSPSHHSHALSASIMHPRLLSDVVSCDVASHHICQDFAHQVVQRILDPRFVIYMASCDVTSHVCQTLAGGGGGG
jgi:hypothetical protein